MNSRVLIGVAGWLIAVFLNNAVAAEGAQCVIDPSAKVEVTTAEMGILQAVYVERGDSVEEGQPIAMLSSETEKAGLELATIRAQSSTNEEQAETRFMHLGRKVARSDDLHKKAFLSTDEIDEIETERRLAEIKLKQAKEEAAIAKADQRRAQAALDLRTVKSPISGLVTKRSLSVGEFAQTKPIMTLVQVDPLYVELMLPMKLYGKFKKGAPMKVRPEHPIGGAYVAKVIVVDPIIDGASGTFGVRLELPNKDRAIPAGIQCSVDL